MAERELITIGFGNFSNLVAAQWANGTSQYDVHHKTLYYERGKGYMRSFEGHSESSRVLRLLLLDAPHASYLTDLAEIETNAEAEGNTYEEDHRDPFFSRHPMRISQNVNLSEEERRFERAVRFMQGRWGRARSSDENGSEGEDLSEEENEEDCSRGGARVDVENHEDPYYATINVSSGRNLSPPNYHDSAAQPLSSPREPPHKKHDPEVPLDGRKSLKKLQSRLFREKDPLVSWWKYIRTGIDPGNFTTLHPFHPIAPVGEVPAIHNVGYGLAHFKSDISPDARELAENLRHQLEEADLVQGLQCFVDGDSLFSGAAHNTLREFWEDAGSKTPVAMFAIFTPLPAETQPQRGAYASQSAPSGRAKAGDLSLSTAPFANQRREEVCLNRLLSTSLLSEHGSALYVPIEIGNWPSFFSAQSNTSTLEEGRSKHSGCWWLDEDAAAAQYLAAVLDTALYGTRDGASQQTMDPREMAACESAKRPAYYLSEWCSTLRPSSSWRISALFGSLPLPVDPQLNPLHNRELWSFLETTPLLGFSEKGGVSSKRGFTPLSHEMPYSPLSSAGRVLGHTFTLRGAGVLPSRVYSTEEAMLHYALPLRTSSYLPLLTRSNYPISSTFPLEILFDSKQDFTAGEKILKESSFSSSAPSTKAVNSQGDLQERWASTDVGSHVVTTFNSAPMLDSVVKEAQKALHYKMSTYCGAYWMEEEDWKERIEDVLGIRDDYRHEPTEHSDTDYQD